jgi:hypothetical protein
MTQPPPVNALDYRTSSQGVREIAARQRAICLCILGVIVLYIALVAGQKSLPPIAILALSAAILAIDITAVVFVFLMTTKLYGTGIGILLGILTFLPCAGIITLLAVNAKATAILKQAGLKVGLLGATVPDNYAPPAASPPPPPR